MYLRPNAWCACDLIGMHCSFPCLQLISQFVCAFLSLAAFVPAAPSRRAPVDLRAWRDRDDPLEDRVIFDGEEDWEEGVSARSRERCGSESGNRVSISRSGWGLDPSPPICW